MLRLLLRGYSEHNQKEELYLHEALRKSDSEGEFKNICIVLGKAGGLFCVPTLMAYARDRDTPKAKFAQDAINQIHDRVIERDNPEMEEFFTPSFWQPLWLGSKEQFMSYVACIAGVFNNDRFFEDDILDKTANRLMREIQVDIAPHADFRELRLCTSGWETKEDIVKVLEEIQQDILLETVTSAGKIIKSPEVQYEDNIINMRCDYLLTRLNFGIDYKTFHYLLKVAHRLNRSSA
ncbi:MAG TPA: hypothetical protein VHZ50_03185 [Puia sp.]|nr:hypothetical protein [Puia sp.]